MEHHVTSPPSTSVPPVTEQPPSAAYDAYQISADDIHEPPESFGQMLRWIGPGLILTASIVGTGELIATTNLGAKAGFALLWLVLLSCFIKVFVQIELGRYAISSGDTTMASFERVPHVGNLLCWWWLGMMLITQFQIGAMIGGSASAIHLMVPVAAEGFAQLVDLAAAPAAEFVRARPDVPWAFLITAITIFLLVRGRYHLVERVSTVLVAMFTLLSVLCVVLLPWVDTTSIPPLPAAMGEETTSLWMAAFAMIGITGVGASELVAYPYWCIEKRYGRYIGPRDASDSWLRRARGWLKVMHADAWVSMIIYTLATLAFYVLGAAVLFPHTNGRGLSETTTGRMLQELAKMYEPLLGHRGSIWFICIGGFVVLYSTLFAATAGNSRVTSDFLRVQQLIPFTPQEYRIRWIRLFSAFLPILGLCLFLFVGSPVSMVVIGGVAQAVTLPLIAGVAIYVRMVRTDRRLVHKGIWDVFLWLSLAMFTIAAGWGIWSEVSKILPR